jgi:hypothetical protein
MVSDALTAVDVQITEHSDGRRSIQTYVHGSLHEDRWLEEIVPGAYRIEGERGSIFPLGRLQALEYDRLTDLLVEIDEEEWSPDDRWTLADQVWSEDSRRDDVEQSEPESPEPDRADLVQAWAEEAAGVIAGLDRLVQAGVDGSALLHHRITGLLCRWRSLAADTEGR